MRTPTRAFVLGAGLGTRLRPLTNNLPKPLVPVFNKPLATFALDHLIAAGIECFAINTHHCPDAYTRILGGGEGSTEYRGRRVEFRHEPDLLETGGGIKNVEDILGGETFVLYNGDILADFPLDPLIEAHGRSANIATLALRSGGAERRIQCDPATGRITNLRGLLGNRNEPSFAYTGIAIFSPEIHNHIPAGMPVSIIPVLAELVRAGAPVGGVVLDGGLWFDIGTPDAYLDIHRFLSDGHHTFSYLPTNWLEATSPSAIVGKSAQLLGCTSIGPRASIASEARLLDTIVWEGTIVPPGSDIANAILSRDFIHHCAARPSAP